MTAFKTTSHVGPDGRLSVTVPPEFANSEVEVTVESAAAGNGRPLPPGTRMPKRKMTREEWREFIRSTAGSMPDFPDIERPGPDEYEDRGAWG